MGLNQTVARAAVRRAHVLIVDVPGFGLERIAMELAVAERGWVLASSPADADALVVCGVPGDELAPLIEHVWEQLPGPRARQRQTASDSTERVLDALTAALLDDSAQRADARSRAARVEAPQMQGHDMAGHDMPSHDGDQMAGHDADDHGMDMDMSGPAGIPLADGSEADRDGLEMDVLNITLGPILRHWPAGLVVELQLSGDVVLAVSARFLDTAAPVVARNAAALGAEGSTDRDPDAAHPESDADTLCLLLDRCARLVALSGWSVAAQWLTRLRNRLAAGEAPGDVMSEFARVRARIRRSFVLRWSLRRSGSNRFRAAIDLDATLAGWLAAAHDLAHGARVVENGSRSGSTEPFRTSRAADGVVATTHSASASVGVGLGLDDLAALLGGLELSDCRLAVAAVSLDVPISRARVAPPHPSDAERRHD